MALLNPLAFQGILAITFTNKASAEMKSRIIETLESIAKGNGKARAFEKAILEEFPDWDGNKLRDRCSEVYRQILHDYSKFSVSTIDKFVQRIIRSFAWELGLDGAYRLQLDMEPVKVSLAEAMYRRLDRDPALRSWILEFAIERLAEGKNWDFKEDAKGFASQLFNEKFAPFETWIRLHSDVLDPTFTALQSRTMAYADAVKKRWIDLAGNILQVASAQGLDVCDFSNGKSGFFNTFCKIAEETIEVPGIRFQKIVSDGAPLVSKTAKADIKTAIAAIEDQVRDACAKIMQWVHDDLPDFNTANVILKHTRILRIMAVFVQELAIYRKENNVLLISDTHHLLNQLTKDITAPFMYEKIGNRYQHYLIDEFQDTSRFQWENFIPLFEEAMGGGNPNLLVGDVKQAIYRWRNGDWRLLLHEVEDGLRRFKPVEKNLETNYRSSRPVIEFNNLLFARAAAAMQNSLNNEIASAPEEIQNRMRDLGYHEIFYKAYSDCQQIVPDEAKEEGGVKLVWVEKPGEVGGGTLEDEEGGGALHITEAILEAVFNQVLDLLQEGFAPGQIGILTRTNKESRDIITWFSQLMVQSSRMHELHIQPFKIISGDALLLGTNTAVQLLLSALRFLSTLEKDNIALTELRHLYSLLRGHPEFDQDRFARNGNNDLLPPLFWQNEYRYRSMPVNDLVHQLTIDLGLHHFEGHDDFISQFYNVVAEWAKQGEGDAAGFLTYWEEEGCKLTLPANPSADALEVLTIHKSKGLAFDVVLLPFLNWKIRGGSGLMADILWVDASETRFNDIPVLPVTMTKKLAGTRFAKDYFEELVLTGMDSLNVLYVAATRARQRWYGWLPQDYRKNQENIVRISHLIDRVARNLDEDEKTASPIHEGYVAQTGAWQHGNLVKTDGITPLPSKMQRSGLVLTDYKSRVKLRYRPLEVEEESHEELLPRQTGLLYHAILARMNRPADLEKAILHWQEKGLLQEEQAQKAREILGRMLQLECLQPWADPQFKTLAERTMINIAREMRRPDLILYNERETMVFDFKFTEKSSQANQYHQQLKEYLELLRQTGFAHPKGWLVFALDNKITEVDL